MKPAIFFESMEEFYDVMSKLGISATTSNLMPFNNGTESPFENIVTTGDPTPCPFCGKVHTGPCGTQSLDDAQQAPVPEKENMPVLEKIEPDPPAEVFFICPECGFKNQLQPGLVYPDVMKAVKCGGCGRSVTGEVKTE